MRFMRGYATTSASDESASSLLYVLSCSHTSEPNASCTPMNATACRAFSTPAASGR